MSIGESFLAEFDQEMRTTRRLVERVPDGRGEWRPHQRSFPLGHLAQLVARMPGWVDPMLRAPHLDLGSYPGYTFETTATLLRILDDGVREGRAALVGATDPSFAEPWSLRHGERILVTLPRLAMLRVHLNHLVHHRGQLSVYLRILDVPIPSLYGPSADER